MPFKVFLSITAWPAICFLSFVGNATLLDAPVALVTLFILPIAHQFRSFYLTEKNTSIALFLSLLYFIFSSFSEGVSYSGIYVLWPIFAILIGISLRILVTFYVSLLSSVLSLDDFKSITYRCILSILLIILFAFLGGSTDESERLQVFLGPNNLYRLIIANLVIGFNFSASLFERLLITLLSFVLLIATGAKGAIVSLLIFILLFILSRFNPVRLNSLLKSNFKFNASAIFRIGTILIVFVSAFFYLWVNLDFGSSRAIASFFTDFPSMIMSSERFSIYSVDPASFLSDFAGLGPGWFDMEFSDGMGFSYPHNIFFELIAYYGILGTFVCLLLIADVFTALKIIFAGPGSQYPGFRGSNLNINYMFDKIISTTFVAIFLGSLFSGDLFDNVACISFLVYRRIGFKRL